MSCKEVPGLNLWIRTRPLNFQRHKTCTSFLSFLKAPAQPLPSLQPSAFQPRRTAFSTPGFAELRDKHWTRQRAARQPPQPPQPAVSQDVLWLFGDPLPPNDTKSSSCHNFSRMLQLLGCLVMQLANQHNVLPPPVLSRLPCAHELPGESNALSCRNLEFT